MIKLVPDMDQNWMLGNIACFFIVDYAQSVKQFDPDQAWCFVGTDLGQNCLQRLYADAKVK